MLEHLEARQLFDSTGSVGSGAPFATAQPSLAVHYIIAMEGLFPNRGGVVTGAGGAAMLGEIRLYAGSSAPDGWAFCDGQLLSVGQFAALFAVIGTSFGGDGQTTFELPNLRGSGVVGAENSSIPGVVSGGDSRTLPLNDVPSHNASLTSGGHTGSTGGGNALSIGMPNVGVNYIIAEDGMFSYLGEIRLFAGNFAPGGWGFCDGQLLSIDSNTALYAKLGTTYGGDGMTTFALPDLQGQLPVGVGDFTDPGEVEGSPSVTLNVANLPVHRYSLPSGGTTGNVGSGTSFSNLAPSLTVQYLIALEGSSFADNGIAILGQIMPYAGPIQGIPAGWALCDGSGIAIAEDMPLSDVLGTTYGGDGQTFFSLPNLVGRTAVEAGTDRQGVGRSLGEQFGSSTTTLSVTNLPFESLTLPNVTTAVTADAATISAGSTAGFTIALANTGAGSVAGGLTFSDTLPDLGGGQTWSINTAAAGTNPTDFQIVLSGGHQLLELASGVTSLANGSPISVDVAGTPAAATTASIMISDSASSDTPDETIRNQSGSDSVTVLSPIVTVTNAADAATVTSGSAVGYTIVLSNTGLSTASALSLSDALPALGGGNLWSIASDPASAFQITGSAGSQQLSLNSTSASLAAGGSLTVHITGTAVGAATLSTTATVSASNEAASLQNATSTALIHVKLAGTTVSSISRVGNAIVNPGASDVSWTVTFADAVSGLSAADFTLLSPGLTGAMIDTLTPSGGAPSTTWTVTATTGTGDGTLQLNLTSADDLNRPVSNLPFMGDTTTIDRTAPHIMIGSPSSAAVQSGGSVTFLVTYSDANFNASTLSAANVTLANSGAAGDTAAGTVEPVTGNGTTRTITIDHVTGNGTLHISLSSGTATDLAGNSAGSSGPSTGFDVDALSITSGALASTQWTNGSASYGGTIPISGGIGPFSVFAQSGLPAGLIATTSGAAVVFTGSPTTAGTYSNVQITVKDHDGFTTSGTFSLNVTKATPIIGSVNAVNITYGTPLDDSQLSGSASATLNGNGVSVPGSFTYTSAATSVLNAAPGQSESVTFTPTDTTDYNTAAGSVVVNVAKATSTITNVNAVNITYGTALSDDQLSGSSSASVNGNVVTVVGTFTYSSAGGMVLNAAMGQSEDVTFTPTDTTDYTGAAGSVTVNVAQATPSVTVNAITLSPGTPLANGQLGGSASATVNGMLVSVDGSFVFTTAAGTTPATGTNQSEAVTFIPTDNVDFASVNTAVVLNVGRSATVIHAFDAGGVYTGGPFAASGSVYVGTTAVATPIFTYYNLSDKIERNPLTGPPVNAGSYFFTASFAGNSTYLPTSTSSGAITITRAQTVMHASDRGGVYNGKPYVATGFAYFGTTPVATPVFNYYLLSDKTESHPLSGAPANPGKYFFTATFAGNSNFLPTATSSGEFDISIPVTSFVASAVHVNTGVTFNGTAATFSAPAALAASFFTATINWGDGTTSTAGTVSAGATKGQFKIVGGHKWAKKGPLTIMIALLPAGTTPIIAMASIT